MWVQPIRYSGFNNHGFPEKQQVTNIYRIRPLLQKHHVNSNLKRFLLQTIVFGALNLGRIDFTGTDIPSLPLTWHLSEGTWKMNFLLAGPPVKCHVSGREGTHNLKFDTKS